jgi:hypothetical protein
MSGVLVCFFWEALCFGRSTVSGLCFDLQFKVERIDLSSHRQKVACKNGHDCKKTANDFKRMLIALGSDETVHFLLVKKIN